MVHPFIIRPQRLAGYGAGVAADTFIQVNYKCDLSIGLRHWFFSLFFQEMEANFFLSFLKQHQKVKGLL
jgi:hypothetical protein